MLRLLCALYKGCKPHFKRVICGESRLSDRLYEFVRFEERDLPDVISLLNLAEKNLRDFRPYTEDEFLLNVLQDEAFDPEGLILLKEARRLGHGSKLVGATLAIVDPEYVRFQHQRRGFLRWIRVAPGLFSDARRKSLLETSLKFIASKGMREALVSVPSHNREDLKFYLSNGFSLARRFNYMERSLDGIRLENALPSGYVWTHFRKGEEAEWVACINDAFREHWGKRPTSLSEFTRWTVDPSFDPTGIIGIRKAAALVGVIYCEIDAAYAEYTGRRRSMLWVIGVIPPERGLGLGEKLTVQGMNWSHSKGTKIAALFVDGENIPAVSLYRKLKFEVEYEVHHLLRGLETAV